MKMESNNWNELIVQFDEIAGEYDQQRKKLIPCFDDFYTIPVTATNINNDSPNILDIGAGTGLFSAFMLNKYPKASVTLIDISEKMLDIAKLRFENHSNVRFIVGDYTQYEFDDRYDIVISSLSIHHLMDAEKKNLYTKIYSIMKNESVFVNADQVLGSTPYLEALYKDNWKRKIESSGLSKKEIEAAYERTKLDKMATLDDQINWLREVGFLDVDCIYKYNNFVVLFGRK